MRRGPDPRITPLPPVPDLSAGSCRQPGADPDWWITGSNTREQREAARAICRRCPVFAACETFALTLPQSDHGIYAAMVPHERERRRSELRKAARAAAARRPSAWQLNAAKDVCSHGHQLSGGNLVVTTNSRTGRPRRACRECQRRWARNSMRLRRLLDRKAAARQAAVA